MYGAAKMGLHFIALGPKQLAPDPKILRSTQELSQNSGAKIEYTDNISEALLDADVIYTDVWISMGEKVNYTERINLLTPYRVTSEMMRKSNNPNCLFMHCLPSFHDFNTQKALEFKDKGLDIREVTDDVFRSKNSVVFDEAETHIHSIKAVMVATL